MLINRNLALSFSLLAFLYDNVTAIWFDQQELLYIILSQWSINNMVESTISIELILHKVISIQRS